MDEKMLHGLTMEQYLALAGFMDGLRLRRELANVQTDDAPPPVGLAAEQAKASRQRARQAITAKIEAVTKGEGVYFDGVRFAMSAPTIGE